MNWDEFYKHSNLLALFDLPLAEQMMMEPRPQVVQQIHRWAAAGRIVPLRRGWYTLSSTYRKKPLSPLFVANEMYRPSYLSGLWAMGYYDLIPEGVVLFTSVTTRVTRRFINPLGEFAYSSIRHDLFRNFTRREIDGSPVWIADPEKAMLDHWYLSPGEWDEGRMEEMRWQGFETVDRKRLKEYAVGYPPRVGRAVMAWERIAEREGES